MLSVQAIFKLGRFVVAFFAKGAVVDGDLQQVIASGFDEHEDPHSTADPRSEHLQLVYLVLVLSERRSSYNGVLGGIYQRIFGTRNDNQLFLDLTVSWYGCVRSLYV